MSDQVGNQNVGFLMTPLNSKDKEPVEFAFMLHICHTDRSLQILMAKVLKHHSHPGLPSELFGCIFSTVNPI